MRLWKDFLNIFGRTAPKTPGYTLNNLPPSNVAVIYDVVLEEAINIYSVYVVNKKIQVVRGDTRRRSFIEAFIFILWEIDLNLCLMEQSDKTRKKTYEVCLRVAMDLSKADFKTQDVVELGYKRFEEYGYAYSKGNGDIGTPNDLVANYLVHNMNFSEQTGAFYVVDGPRGMHLIGMMTIVELFSTITRAHFGLKVYCSELLINCSDYTILGSKMMLEKHGKAVKAMAKFRGSINKNILKR